MIHARMAAGRHCTRSHINAQGNDCEANGRQSESAVGRDTGPRAMMAQPSRPWCVAKRAAMRPARLV